MTLKLTAEDRNAINLVLDQAASATSQGYAAAAGTEHVRAARRVFDLLQVLPAPEPSADLAVRTLALVSKAASALPSQMLEPLTALGVEGQRLRPA